MKYNLRYISHIFVVNGSEETVSTVLKERDKNIFFSLIYEITSPILNVIYKSLYFRLMTQHC